MTEATLGDFLPPHDKVDFSLLAVAGIGVTAVCLRTIAWAIGGFRGG